MKVIMLAGLVFMTSCIIGVALAGTNYALHYYSDTWVIESEDDCELRPIHNDDNRGVNFSKDMTVTVQDGAFGKIQSNEPFLVWLSTDLDEWQEEVMSVPEGLVLTEQKATDDLLEKLARGKRLVVDANGSIFGPYSLKGSRDAIEKWKFCSDY